MVIITDLFKNILWKSAAFIKSKARMTESEQYSVDEPL